MDDKKFDDYTGHSSQSLNEALEKAISKSEREENELEVVETLSISNDSQTNYQIKLKAKQKELCEDV